MANFPTFCRDRTAQNRDGMPNANWGTGCDLTGLNAPIVGVNFSEIDPSESSWPRIADTGPHMSGGIGLDPTAGENMDTNWRGVGSGYGVHAFLQAATDVAADAILGSVGGFDFYNRTGQTIPAGSWAWGSALNPARAQTEQPDEQTETSDD